MSKSINQNSLLSRLTKFEFPHPILIIFSFVIIAALFTYIIPGGQYEREQMNDGRLVVKPGSFHFIPHVPQGFLKLVLVPFNGLMESADIIFLILIIGGAFGVITGTGALTAGIYRATQSLKGRELLIIPILMILFAAAGGIFGMYEEVLPFVGIVVPMCIAIGYDSIVGIAIVYLSTVLGFCGAFVNPFTLGIAQGIAGLPPLSGMGYRLVVFCVTVGAGIIYTMIYARKIKKNPKLSLVYESDSSIRANYNGLSENNPDFILTRKRLFILILLGAGFALLPFGVIKLDWGLRELTGLFFGLALIVWIINGGKNLNRGAEDFVEGAKGLVNAALLIGIARGIKIMLDDGMVMDTILYYLSSTVSHFPKVIAIQMMFFVQSALSCILQSGSAQAAVSMPLMVPLSDLLHITRQTAVLAYQMGDGFSNFAIPWTGITLAVLTLGNIPIWTWFRWAFILQLIQVTLHMLLLIWPTVSNWGPF